MHSSTDPATTAVEAAAATNIAPYSPERWCVSRASAHASRAARPGSPGVTQPYTSARIWAPIQSWNGLPRRPATSGSSPARRLR